MPPTTPPLDDWHHEKGYEIATKHKEAIRQLHWFGKVPVCVLQRRYKDLAGKPLGESTIRKILGYPAPERARPKAEDLHSFYLIKRLMRLLYIVRNRGRSV
jgi:hypothetical protein